MADIVPYIDHVGYVPAVFCIIFKVNEGHLGVNFWVLIQWTRIYCSSKIIGENMGMPMVIYP